MRSRQHKGRLFLLLLGLSLAVVRPLSASPLFSDNFNAGASGAWGNERGDWRDTGGIYDATNPNNNPLTYSSVTTLPALTNFIAELDVNAINDGGVWLRSDFNGGNINGVLLVTGGSNGTNNGFYWHIVQNGNTDGGGNPGSVPGLQGSDGHLKIVVNGNDYSVYLNGDVTPIATLNTNLFASGSFGLYDFSPVSKASNPRGQTFDNVEIFDIPASAVAEPASLLLFGSGLLGLAVMLRRLRGTRFDKLAVAR